jgi:hypothetical protein
VVKHPLHPSVVRRIHNQDEVEITALAGFHEQRDVLHHHVIDGGGFDHGCGAGPDQRVDDTVQRREARRITKHQGTEFWPVQPAVSAQDLVAELSHDPLQALRPGFHHLPCQRVGIHQHGSAFP